MLRLTLIAGVLIASTVVIHAAGTTTLVRGLRRHFAHPVAILKDYRAITAQIWATAVLMVLHIIEIHVWALAYLVAVPGEQLDNYEKVAYFSFVTFTSLGYGDIVLDGPERVLSGIEALNGMLLIGWSAALLFVVVQRAWRESDSTP